MLWHMYQVFSSLQGHLHFFVHFFFTFMGQFFLGHPIHSRVRSGLEADVLGLGPNNCDGLDVQQIKPWNT